MRKVGVQHITDQKKRVAKLTQQGEYEEARILCEILCLDNSEDAESHYMLGSIYGKLHNYAKAAIQFKEVIRLQPGAFAAHNSYGMALTSLGEHEAAEKAFRDALGLKSDHENTLIKLAYVLDQQGNTDESETYIQRVLNLNPSSAPAYDALGNLCYQKVQYKEAIKYYGQAISCDPSRIHSHTYMGNSLLRLGQSEKAVICFDQALTLDPKNLDANLHLGHALKSIGDSTRARESYRKVLEIDPDNLIALSGIVDLCEREGDFEGAYEILLPLMKSGKTNADLASSLVRLCHRFDYCNEAIEYALEALENETMAAPDRAHLEYALGRRYDLTGNFDAAFSHYQRANSLCPYSFDPVNHENFINALIQGFSSQFISSSSRATVRSCRPVFVVGMPRSGTSLIEQILASHPQIYGAGELNFFGEEILSNKSLSNQAVQYPTRMDNLTGELLDDIANRYLKYLNELNSEAVRVTDKQPINFLHLGLISLVFPDAHIIHCTREKRDTCLSLYFQSFSESNSYANNLESIGFFYRQYEKFMQHFKSLNSMPILDVAYENLVTNQEEMSRELIDFIGLDWDDQCLAFHENSRYVSTPSYDQVREKIYSRSVGRWKNYEKHLAPLFEALEQ